MFKGVFLTLLENDKGCSPHIGIRISYLLSTRYTPNHSTLRQWCISASSALTSCIIYIGQTGGEFRQRSGSIQNFKNNRGKTEGYTQRILNAEYTSGGKEDTHDIIKLDRNILYLNALKDMIFTSAMTYRLLLSYI